MPSEPEPAPIDDLAAVELVDHGGQVVSQVVLVIVVHLSRLPDDRRIGLHDGVAEPDQILDRTHAEVRKRVLVVRAAALVVALLVLVLPGIEPEHRRKPGSRLVSGRQRDVDQEPEAVGPLDGEALSGRRRQVGRVVDVAGELHPAGAVDEVALRRLGRGFPRHDEPSCVDVEDRRELLVRVPVVSLEDPLLLSGPDSHPIQESHRGHGQWVLVVLSPVEEHMFAVGRQLHGPVAGIGALACEAAGGSRESAARHDEQAGVRVEVLAVVVEQRLSFGLRILEVYGGLVHLLAFVFGDEQDRHVRGESVGGDPALGLVDDREAGVVEGMQPLQDAVRALWLFRVLGPCLRVVPSVVLPLPLEEGQAASVDPPGHLPPSLRDALPCLAAAGRTSSGSIEPGVQGRLVKLPQDVALEVPDLLDAAEVVDRDDVAERMLQAGDPCVPPIGREVEVPHHRRWADELHVPTVHVDQGQLPRGVPRQEGLVVRRLHEAGERAQPVLALFGHLDLGARRHGGLDRPRGAVFGNQHRGNLVAPGRPLVRRRQRGQHGSTSDPLRPACGRVRYVDVRAVAEVSEERQPRALWRPGSVGDTGPLGDVDVHPCSVGGRRRHDSGIAAGRQPAAAVRRRVDEFASELIEGLGEDVHRHRPVADFLQEPLPVGAHVRQRHVEVSRCQDGLRDRVRRRHELLLFEDASRVPRYALILTPALGRKPKQNAGQEERDSVEAVG